MAMPNKGQQYRRLAMLYLAGLVGCAVLMGVLHCLFADVKLGKVYWFHLDKERNLPTWFSGFLFFLFAVSSLLAYFSEKNKNREYVGTFRLPVLWVGVAMIGLLMSLDEMTVLHENLFWKEVRQASENLGGIWRYITQWQLLFAPVIVILLGYFVLFFYNRYRSSARAWYCSSAGLGCWIAALSLESIRQWMKFNGENWYAIEVILEEELEMIGAILLLASIVFYTIDITWDFNEERRIRILSAAKFFSKKAVTALILLLLTLGSAGGVVYYYAMYLVKENAPLASLYKKANRSKGKRIHK